MMTVDDYIWNLLRTVCEKHQVKTGEFFGGPRTKKTRAIVDARMEFVRTMRAEVVLVSECFPELRKEACAHWLPYCKPISFPALADIMGLDHSTLVLMNGRERKRIETEAREITTNPH